jgi:hypothetical protein
MKIKHSDTSNPTENQRIAKALMSIVAKIRDEMPYMRQLKSKEFGKMIFSEYIEGWVCDAFELRRSEKTNEPFDAYTKDGKTVEIKDVTKSAPKIDEKFKADFLITVKLNKKDFSVEEVRVFPKKEVLKHLNTPNWFNSREARRYIQYPQKK